MPYDLFFAIPADKELKRLEGLPGEAGLVKQIKKALGNLSRDPKHPSLQTHKFHGLPNPLMRNSLFLKPMPNSTPREPLEFYGVLAARKEQLRSLPSLPIHSSRKAGRPIFDEEVGRLLANQTIGLDI